MKRVNVEEKYMKFLGSWKDDFTVHGRLTSMMTSYYLSRSVEVAYSR